ncbi:unnamed protein product [Ostreobium quekettii]|uniref:Uncharacterized protein n=1 Tax=Ostreobium quekettii TaxID=121088 RepID=A0A8S1IN76_9CHLO|nr:unnamed protein product [Ostreobium quekettii]
MIGGVGPLAPGNAARAKGGRGAGLLVRAEADYYDTLGVPRGASKKEIKSAYRQKARKYHPDVNKEPGAEENFKKIGEAYEVLSDDQKKRIYDQYGEAGLKGGMGGFPGSAGMDFTNPFDLFESLFGGGTGGFGGMGGMGGMGATRSRAQPGDDLRVDMRLEFLEAVFGTSKEVSISRLAECKTCSGSGVKSGTTAESCSQCGGSGQVVSSMRTPLGAFQQVSTCPSCEGTGQTFTPCQTCGGDGRVNENKRTEVQVPAGIDDGSRLRIRGEGNAGRRGGPPGDLYVFVSVKSHPQMRRKGTTVHTDVEVSFVDAILGTTVKVPTVDGMVDLKVPQGTQPDTTLLMAKRGVPVLGSSTSRGDHKVHVRVKIPSKLSNEEKKLVEKLRDIQASKHNVGPSSS